MHNVILLTIIVVTYDDKTKEKHRFTDAVKAQRFAQDLVDQKKENIVSVNMVGLYGQREFMC